MIIQMNPHLFRGLIALTAAICLAAPAYGGADELATVATVELDGYRYFDIVQLTTPLNWQMKWDPVVRSIDLVTPEGVRIGLLVDFDFADVGGLPLRLPNQIRQHQGQVLISTDALQAIRGLLEQPKSQAKPPPKLVSAQPPTAASSVEPVPAGLPPLDEPPALMAATETKTATAMVPPALPPLSAGPGPQDGSAAVSGAPALALELNLPSNLKEEQRTDLAAGLNIISEAVDRGLSGTDNLRLWPAPAGASHSNKVFGASKAGAKVWLALSALHSQNKQLACSVFIHPGNSRKSDAGPAGTGFEESAQPFAALSQKLAEALVAQLEKDFPKWKISGVKKNRIADLEGIKMPAVWIELNVPNQVRLSEPPERQTELTRLGETLAGVVGKFRKQHPDE